MEDWKLPNFVVTPRGGYFNYEGDENTSYDYKDFESAKIQEAKINAVNKAISLKGPITPKVPNRPARIFRHMLGDWYDDNDAMFIFGYENDPNSCIYTQTSLYGHPETRNTEFKKDPSKYGFTETLTPGIGDLVQLDNYKGTPHHMMMITGFDKFGKPVLTYPKGRPSDPYVIDNDQFWDTNKEHFRYYTFGGNAEDKSNWKKEYKWKTN